MRRVVIPICCCILVMFIKIDVHGKDNCQCISCPYGVHGSYAHQYDPWPVGSCWDFPEDSPVSDDWSDNLYALTQPRHCEASLYLRGPMIDVGLGIKCADAIYWGRVTAPQYATLYFDVHGVDNPETGSYTVGVNAVAGLPPCDVDVSISEDVDHVNTFPAQWVASDEATVRAMEQWMLIGDDGAGFTGVEDGVLPLVWALHASVPNPFNPQTTIAFELPEREAVTLRVFDVAGRLVRVLINGEAYDQGRHEAIWRGRDDAGRQMSSGTYFYRFEAGEFRETKRMVLLK